MSDFSNFLTIGLEHIIDIGAYDHLLFIASLVLAYRLSAYRKLIGLLTAFTLGHGISAALSYLDLSSIPTELIEWLIPLTIIIMAVYHGFIAQRSLAVAYTLAFLFGLIHGLAYAGEFMAMMGRSPSVIVPLMAFNLGVELAQIGFGLVLLVIFEWLIKAIPQHIAKLRILIFGLIILSALRLAVQNWPW